MRIIIATEAYYPLIDGGAVAEHHLALELAKKGHDVHILAPSLTFSDAIEIDNGTTIHRFASYPIPFVKNDHRLAWRPRSKIFHLLETLSPDIVHIHNPFPIGKATLEYCQKHHIPVVATNHWLPENITTFIAKFRFVNSLNVLVKWNWEFIARFHNACDFVTSPTQTAIDLMVQNGLTAPHTNVSNGVELDRFSPHVDPTSLKQLLQLPDKPTALYAGRLSGEKHVDVFMRAIPGVLRTVDAHFIIGGSGREKASLQALAHDLGITNHVTFPGFLDDIEFPKLYRSADVFVMPSICELQSITTLEAMASGLPVIAANKYALPELVKHGKNGYLFEPGDYHTLSTQLTELLTSTDTRAAMSQESLAIVGNHSLPKTISDYEAIYQKLLSTT